MNIQYHYKHINDVIKPDLEDYIQSKLEDLSKYIADVSEDSVLAEVSIEHFEKHDAYQVDMRITVRSGKEILFQAQETKHTYTESIDAVRDKLQMQLIRHKDKKQTASSKPKAALTEAA